MYLNNLEWKYRYVCMYLPGFLIECILYCNYLPYYCCYWVDWLHIQRFQYCPYIKEEKRAIASIYIYLYIDNYYDRGSYRWAYQLPILCVAESSKSQQERFQGYHMRVMPLDPIWMRWRFRWLIEQHRSHNYIPILLVLPVADQDICYHSFQTQPTLVEQTPRLPTKYIYIHD